MVDFWIIFPLFCIVMMLFMFFGRNSDHEQMGCIDMMNGSKEQELKKEIDVLREEIMTLRKVKH
jgi:hypothetical protein